MCVGVSVGMFVLSGMYLNVVGSGSNLPEVHGSNGFLIMFLKLEYKREMNRKIYGKESTFNEKKIWSTTVTPSIVIYLV
jgi:hypothetical protein